MEVRRTRVNPPPGRCRSRCAKLTIMSALLTVLAMYAFTVVLLLALENSIIFLPSRALWTTPAKEGVPHDEVWLRTSDGVKLHAWLLHGQRPAGTPARTVLFLHGNAGNIADRLENGILLTRQGLDVLLLEYRGYGLSEGSPTEEGVCRDADAAYDYLLTRPGTSAKNLVLFGRSLGSGPAVDLAARRPCGALVIESPFCSTRALARDIPVYLPFSPFLPDRFRSLEKIKQVKCPILVIHGSADEVIPYSHGKRLFEAAPEPKRFHVLTGAHHNDWYQRDPETYFRVWREFLAGSY